LAFWKKEVLFLGLVFALGVLLVGVTGPNWKYTWLGGLDNWSYVGYGKHYTDCEYRAGLYKSCRVPWIWWEAAVRSLFPGEPGSRAICFSLLLTWGAGWYLFARQMGSAWVAAGLSLFALLYVPSHGSGGWDYHNGASGVFWVLALAQAVWIRNRATGRPGAWLLLGGWLALAVHTNIILLNTAPLFLALLWPEFRRKDGPGFARGLGWILAGFLGLTFVLAAINVAIGRRPFFYWKILQTAFVFVEDTSHNKPLYEPLGAPWSLRGPLSRPACGRGPIFRGLFFPAIRGPDTDFLRVPSFFDRPLDLLAHEGSHCPEHRLHRLPPGSFLPPRGLGGPAGGGGASFPGVGLASRGRPGRHRFAGRGRVEGRRGAPGPALAANHALCSRSAGRLESQAEVGRGWSFASPFGQRRDTRCRRLWAAGTVPQPARGPRPDFGTAGLGLAPPERATAATPAVLGSGAQRTLFPDGSAGAAGLGSG